MTRAGGENRGLFERPAKSGIWWVRYADEFGREHREKIGSKALARKVYTKRKAAILERRFNPEAIRRRDVTLAQAVKAHLEASAGMASYRDKERYGERWIDELGHRPLRQLTAGDIERVVGQHRKAGASKYVVYQELSFLRKVCTNAVRDGLIDKSPLPPVKAVQERRVRYLTDDEEAALVKAIAAEWRPLVILAIHTGLRAGEQLKLKWAQVDLVAKVVHLPKTKSGKSRSVPLNDAALDALRRTPRHLTKPSVFRGERDDNALNHSWFSKKVWRPAIRAAKLANLRWHDLRHTFASRLAMAGVDLYTIADLLGHADLQNVQRYAHLSPAHRTRAVAVLTEKRNRHQDRHQRAKGKK